MLKFLAKIKKIAVFNSILSILILQPSFAADTGKMACKRAGVKEDTTFMNIQTAAFETIDNMLPIEAGYNAGYYQLCRILNNFEEKLPSWNMIKL